MLPDGTSVALEPLASEIARRFHREYPDELSRHGEAGREWCIHDNQYVLAWAITELTMPHSFRPNVVWLASVLDRRGYPLERLARDLELAADVVREAVPGYADELCKHLAAGAAAVRADAGRARPESDARHVQLRDAFLAAVLCGDPLSGRQLVEAAADEGVPVRELYLAVVQPALRQVGELWASGHASVAQEHLATATAQTLLAGLAPRLERSGATERTAVVASVEGELHSVGSRFIADFLEADGWRVLDIGASVPAVDLVAFVAETRPDLVAVSTTLTTNLDAAKDVLARLRALPERPLLAAGGRAFGGDGERARRLGADVFAPDADELARELARRFAA